MKMRSLLFSITVLTSLSVVSAAVAAETRAVQPAPGESGEYVPATQGKRSSSMDAAKASDSSSVQENTVIEELSPAAQPAEPQASGSTGYATPSPSPAASVDTRPAAYDKAINETAKINAVNEVLHEITGIPEGISPTLLGNAYGIVIIPGNIKLSFFFGGQYGSGIAMMRRDDGSWSNPSFVYLAGGSFGLQFGALSSDIILVFKTRKSIVDMAKGNFTLGADAAVAAGPVGRRAEASTDWQLKAEIYSYARSRGLFAGISLDGSVLAIDTKANAVFYGVPGISASEVFAQAPTPSPAVVRLKDFLNQNSAAISKQ
jgi:lipid-binding SYLF domain-containing protein